MPLVINRAEGQVVIIDNKISVTVGKNPKGGGIRLKFQTLTNKEYPIHRHEVWVRLGSPIDGDNEDELLQRQD